MPIPAIILIGGAAGAALVALVIARGKESATVEKTSIPTPVPTPTDTTPAAPEQPKYIPPSFTIVYCEVWNAGMGVVHSFSNSAIRRGEQWPQVWWQVSVPEAMRVDVAALFGNVVAGTGGLVELPTGGVRHSIVLTSIPSDPGQYTLDVVFTPGAGPAQVRSFPFTITP